ncbi:RICIN domain-containing protein [Streptomyces pseudogriseolus]|uniref:RICIN domain-containing protein n=1 Tax=Streptomyces TaxID=1883 RepID=UPI001F1EB876|nr:RICIN domain-containing protein [Streptomyces sp. NRRL S-1314]
MVNVASGLCLDVSGAFTNGTDVITALCSSSRAQRWRVDDDRGLLQSAADPDFCLDSRGATHRGVGIWECDSVEGRNGRNLMFAVDEDGLIRPIIALGTAVTPDGGAGDGLSLERQRANYVPPANWLVSVSSHVSRHGMFWRQRLW